VDGDGGGCEGGRLGSSYAALPVRCPAALQNAVSAGEPRWWRDAAPVKGRHTGREVAPEHRSRGGGPHWQGSREMGEAVPEGRSSGLGWRGGARWRFGTGGGPGSRGRSRPREVRGGAGYGKWLEVLVFFFCPAEGREYKTG